MSKNGAAVDAISEVLEAHNGHPAGPVGKGYDLDKIEHTLETSDLSPEAQLNKLEEFSAILRYEARHDVYGELEELIASLEMKIYHLRHATRPKTREIVDTDPFSGMRH